VKLRGSDAFKEREGQQGETRSRSLRARLVARGFGVCVSRGRVHKADRAAWKHRWFYDNGAWLDHVAGRPFDDSAFLSDVLEMVELPESERPAFVTLPDEVAASLDSLRLSLSWLARVGRLSLRWALVVQNGVTPDDVPWEARFAVLFVGGDAAWKCRTMRMWSQAAHEHGRTCHVGRVGSAKRLRAAHVDGVDSVDSALPLFAERNLKPFLREFTLSETQLLLAR
jgi:hypothetical protein